MYNSSATGRPNDDGWYDPMHPDPARWAKPAAGSEPCCCGDGDCLFPGLETSPPRRLGLLRADGPPTATIEYLDDLTGVRGALPPALDEWGRKHGDRLAASGADMDRWDDLRYAMQCAAEEGRPPEAVACAEEIAFLANEVVQGGPPGVRLARIAELAGSALTRKATREGGQS